MSINREIDSICNDFEENWSKENRPNFQSYIQRTESKHRDDLLEQLLQIDIELRVRAGHSLDVAEYQSLGDIALEIVKRELELQQTIRPLKQSNSIAPNATTDSVSPAEKVRQIGPYRLLQQIGEGGMGTVWMAEQRKPVRRRVALKVIKSGMVDRQVIARFEAERQALTMMDHQCIARVLDAGETEEGNPYFVMELVKGIPITDYCDRNRLNIRDRLSLMSDVCKAIQHAHQKGIIHRDLKPGNVLITEYEGKPIPKVIDFGLAKALEHTTHLTDKTMFTEFGQVVGTLQYMSPEQAALNSADIDTRTDVYALGVMLYELLTGSTPLDRETLGKNALLKLLEIIREQEPPKPSDRLDTTNAATSTAIGQERQIAPARLKGILRGELDWVIMKALDKDRSRRYGSANVMAEDIQRYLENEPVQAKPPTRGYRFRKFVRKNRGLVTTAVTIVTLLIAGAVGSTWFAIVFNKQKKTVERHRENAEIALSESESVRSQIQTFLLKHPNDPEVQQVLDQWRDYQELQITQNQDIDLPSRANAQSYENLARLSLQKLQNGQSSPTVFKVAMDYLQKATSIRERLSAESPNNEYLKREVVNNYQLLAQLYFENQQFELAQAITLKELDIYETDTNMFAADLVSAIDRAIAYSDSSPTAAVEKLLDRKRDLLIQLKDPEVKRAGLHSVALDYANQGVSQFDDTPAAIKLLTQSSELFGAIANEHTKDAKAAEDFAWSLGLLGDKYNEAGDLKKAIENYEQEVQVLDTTNIGNSKHLLSNARVRLGDLLVQELQYEKAKSHFNRDLNYWLKQVKEQGGKGSNSETMKNLAYAYGKLAGLAQLQRQYSVGATHYQTAINHLSQLDKEDKLDSIDKKSMTAFHNQLEICNHFASSDSESEDLGF